MADHDSIATDATSEASGTNDALETPVPDAVSGMAAGAGGASGESAPAPARADLFRAPWPQRLEFIVDTMREVSRQTDPQQMVQSYGRRMRQIIPSDGWVSLSRRDLTTPKYRITRASSWATPVNPWRMRDQLPVYDRGILGHLLYGEEPTIIPDLPSHVRPDDPAIELLHGMGSLVAIPLFDRGVAMNMVVLLRKEPNGFSNEFLPEHVWMANLFGRATHNLVLGDEVKRAYDAVERELKVVGDIQRSLLPTELPNIPTLQLAAHYQTSQRAGGDYYDFFPLENGRWGILIADVSGHGTPAAVLMAVTHSIAHTHDGEPEPPSRLLTFLNKHLSARYTSGTGTFVTAFYGIYDPTNRTLTYSRAGHTAPRVKRCSSGEVEAIDRASFLPLGIDGDEEYADDVEQLAPEDVLIFYTDGITEARSPSGDFFGPERLDLILSRCEDDVESVIRSVMLAVEEFTDDRAPADDQTLLVAKVR